MNNHIEYIFKKGTLFYPEWKFGTARICPFRAQSYHQNSYISHQSAECQPLEVPITFHGCLLSGDTLTILFPLRNPTIMAPIPLRPPSQLITSLHTDESTLKTPL